MDYQQTDPNSMEGLAGGKPGRVFLPKSTLEHHLEGENQKEMRH